MQKVLIDHVVLMIKDVDRTYKFYSKIFGEPRSKDDYSVSWMFGETKLFFGLPFKELYNNVFDRNRIGLNHLAFGVPTLDELKDWENKLKHAGIQNSGILKDKYKEREYIWFDDPDGIRQEFYLRPEGEE